ncbi:MAG: sortase [Candidatus Peregrinibacteria bacterium]
MSSSHQAFYDPDGNIVIPTGDGTVAHEEHTDIPAGETPGKVSWTLIPETRSFHEEASEWKTGDDGITDPSDVTRHVRRSLSVMLGDLFGECSAQYRFSALSAGFSLTRLRNDLARALDRSRAFLLQPVWIVSRNKKPRQYRRATLFLFDTLRFGTTFASIFIVLFATLNFQSFWKITVTHLNPLEHARESQALTASVEETLKAKLGRTPLLARAGEAGDLLSFLPEIGPPENRVIIPKLNLSVPLVTTPFEALMREDWAQVEKDIQQGLQDGVIHYPGTAKPGQAGNFFVTGHSSYYPWSPGKYKTVFARLHELQPNDEFWVYYGGDKHRYIVRSQEEVSPTDVTVLDQPAGKRMATLMTCTPIGTALRRLIVSAEEVDLVTGIALAPGEPTERVVPASRPQALPI